jgi:DNA-directed RNA polymerase subunit RPC12/RpoP
MYCERCGTPGANGGGSTALRSRRRARTARCARCGGRLTVRPIGPPDARVDTHAYLVRFGLAITGDPLLELKR